MPIPFIIAGAAVAAGAYGAKKGYDAKQNYDRASDKNDRAESIVRKAESSLETARKKTNESIKGLGENKFYAYQSLKESTEVIAKVKNIEFNHDLKTEAALDNEQTVTQLNTAVFQFNEVLTDGIGTLGAGGLAGLGAYGAAGTLASASTGTAIGTLSGAAATNATLAWFGGGSLAAGGFGVAGGTAVLGGVVAGPVLAVGGMVLEGRSKKALETANTNVATAKTMKNEMAHAEIKVRAIKSRADELANVVKELTTQLESQTKSVDGLVEFERRKQAKEFEELKLQLLGAVKNAEKNHITLSNKRKSFFYRLVSFFIDTKEKRAFKKSIQDLRVLFESELVKHYFPGYSLPKTHKEVDVSLEKIKQGCITKEDSDNAVDYLLLSDQKKKEIMLYMATSLSLKKLCDVSLLNEEGDLSEELDENLDNAISSEVSGFIDQ